MSRAHLFLRAFLLAALFTVLVPRFVQAEEYIPSFQVEATLASDRTLEVTERIDYDFGTSPHHGIFRQIPLTYERGQGIYRLPIQVLGATLDGASVATKETRNNGELNLRLGDENETITGKHLYVIRYKTDRAITDWSDHQELYWNVNGNGWPVLIKSTSFTLHGPGPVRAAVCYTGVQGSTEHACTVTVSAATASLSATRSLAATEGFTIAISFSLGTMQPLPWWRILWYWLWEHPFIVLPFSAFVIMFLIWWIHGRDPIGRGTIIPQYEEPNGLPPALLSALLHQNVSPREATATILDLARKGYLVLIAPSEGMEESASWSIQRTKKSVEELLPFERTLLQGLASPGETVSLSRDPGTYSSVFYDMSKRLTAELVDHKWFVTDPGQARGCWFVLAMILGFACFFAAESFGAAAFFGGLLSAVIVGVFGWFMPKTTPAGAALTEEVEGLKLFLTVTEKERLAFHDAPEKHPEEFSRLLAAAVALGVEKKWAKQFEHLLIPAPSYVQSTTSNWSALMLVQSIDHLHTNFSHGIASASSSGGSGFSGGSSGGGMGGGGGGSW